VKEEIDPWRRRRGIDDRRGCIKRRSITIGLMRTPAALLMPFTPAALLMPFTPALAMLLMPFTPILVALSILWVPPVPLAERWHHG